MANLCIRDLKVIFHEIKRLEPKTVIFYTFSLYKELLRDIPQEIGALSCNAITSESHTVTCGKKLLGWWERQMTTSWSKKRPHSYRRSS